MHVLEKVKKIFLSRRMMNAQISHGGKKKKKHKNINTMFLSLRSNMVVILIST